MQDTLHHGDLTTVTLESSHCLSEPWLGVHREVLGLREENRREALLDCALREGERIVRPCSERGVDSMEYGNAFGGSCGMLRASARRNSRLLGDQLAHGQQLDARVRTNSGCESILRHSDHSLRVS
jgi:hypothetical protein